MRVLFTSTNEKSFARWRDQLSALDSRIQLVNLADNPDLDSIEIVLAWQPPEGIFPQLNNLKLIQSLGMGVDHLFKCPDLPKDIPISRIIDPDMTEQMCEYALYGTLKAFRKFHLYQRQQRDQIWEPLSRNFHDQFSIGILGFGELGSAITERLYKNGFTNLHVWSRSKKRTKMALSYAGSDELDAFLNELQVLICLLPLTPETTGILNRDTLSKLAPGAFLINPARGEHLIENDLLELLNSGHLSGALLDVFNEEPLPQTHPFWQHPDIEMTPHIAASTNPRTAAEQVLQNIHQIMENKAPLNLIDAVKGY